MARKDISINFVGENLSFLDRFVNWALTVGRVVVILTELIALTAFLYRFSLDRQLIDLHTKIKQEQAVVSYLKNYEETFRDLQNRINLSSDFGIVSQDKIKMLNDVVSFAPSGAVFNNFYIQEDRIRLSITSGSVSAISSFIKRFKSYQKIENVIVEKIEDRASSASITVNITGILKGNAKTKQ